MAPLPRSPILFSVARSRFQQPPIRHFKLRQYATARAATVERAPAQWSSHWSRAGGTAMMYFPVVAVVMFWPVAVTPLMNLLEGV